ncbi:MAG TPA: type IV toxin-antitoxin system AbiEi family antitoxin domain-containing protein, partial [Acidimicrobiia bacterium]|nr:type IV toxin-antitoxin system AbiEi family antitoxin domain-containing protein [Acidimicrobiia bacterium]
MDQSALPAAIDTASRQYSLITWKQALAVGLTPVMLKRLVTRGHWEQLGNGLYRINGAKETWRGTLKAICLRAGEGSAVSHRTAAALWGIEGFHPSNPVDLTVPYGRNPRLQSVRVHRRGVFRTDERDGIPVTPIPETILDLCAVSSDDSIPLRALDDVRRRRLASPFELQRCLSE